MSDLCTAMLLAQSRICGRKDLVRLSKALGYLIFNRPSCCWVIGELNYEEPTLEHLKGVRYTLLGNG